jgi:hypothetical protein
MGALTAGSVILIPFPFSDLSSTKLRPAVVRRVSYARPSKLFTANATLLRQQAGQLTNTCFLTVREQVVKTIRGEAS